MNPVPESMSAMLASDTKDPLAAIEFYLPTYVPSAVHGFEPDQAEALFATETATYAFRPSVTVNYQREVFTMPSLTRNIGKQSNSVTIRLSNISPDNVLPRPLANFVLNNDVEGMRVVIRILSRANLPDPTKAGWIVFVGKCGPSDGFDRKEGSITAKQDLGQIEAVIPPKVFQKDCPLDFGAGDCLGNEELTDKNAAYQAAFAASGRLGCNKTHAKCLEFDNLEFNQGIRVAQIEGSFIHRPHEGFFAKLIGLLTPGSGKRRTRVGNSLEDGTPYGKAIPIVLGRAQLTGIPLQYQDIGTSINFLMAWCRGPIGNILNLRCVNPEFTQPLGVTHHYGRYGGEADQLEDIVFPLGGFYSRLTYTTGYVNGSDIAAEEPAPTIVSMIAGISPPKVTLFLDSISGEGTTDSAGVYQFINNDWSDNPVDNSLYVLTDPALLNVGNDFFDEERTAKTSVYTTGAIQDNTNAERLVLPNTEIGKAGVDYHRYHSTGVVCGGGPTVPTGPTVAGPNTEVTYEFYDPSAPPASVPVKTFFRKRSTCNLALTEQKKAIDVLYDMLLPSFRGFLSWDTRGRIGIRCERPADSSLMRTASIATATSIAVNDVLPWTLQFHENNIPLIGQVLIGVGLITSEVRRVTSTNYSTAGNSITLATSVSGGATLTASGGTFSGGSSSVAAGATVTVGGTFAEDDTVTVTIDGIDVTYTLTALDVNRFKVARALAFAINANRTLQKYVVAHNAALDDVIQLSSKQGVLNLSSALVNAHDVGEETIRVMMSFAGQAADFVAANLTRANILNGSFKYLGNDGQTRYNQFKGKFKDPLRDFADQEVIINDYAHQDQVQKIFPYEIDLSAVDNYWQAAHLLNGAASKYGDGTRFFQWGSNGLALQLEEGDVVCVSDDSGEFINVPVRVESLNLNPKYEVSLKARIYSTSMYDDFVEQTDVPLPSGLTNFASAPPDISFNATDFPPNGLVQSTDGTAGITSIRGGAIFGASPYAMYVKIRLIKRDGVTVNELINTLPGTAGAEVVFEFLASVDGLYTVELEVCNQWGCNSTKPTADIIIGFGSLFGLAAEDGSLLLTEAGDILEIEH